MGAWTSRSAHDLMRTWRSALRRYEPAGSWRSGRLAVVLQQRLDRDFQILAAVEEGELDDAGGRRHDAADALQQRHRRGHGAAGRQKVVDQGDARALGD